MIDHLRFNSTISELFSLDSIAFVFMRNLYRKHIRKIRKSCRYRTMQIYDTGVFKVLNVCIHSYANAIVIFKLPGKLA